MVEVITGRRIGTNRDGTNLRVLLQVVDIPEDVQTVELFTQCGIDSNPANGCRVNVIPVTNSYKIGVGVSDGLTPEVDPGEKEIYSTDNPVTQKRARLKFRSDSVSQFNLGSTPAARLGDTIEIELDALTLYQLAAALISTDLIAGTGNPPEPFPTEMTLTGEITTGTDEVLLP